MSDKLEAVSDFENKFLDSLNQFDFKKKRKGYFIRNKKDCIQHIAILQTKIKGRNEVHIDISIGFTYEKINKVISFIKDEKFDKRWPTAAINMGGIIKSNEPYGFYISESTDLDYIIKNIKNDIENYALDFWQSCDSLEKFNGRLLQGDRNVQLSTYSLNRPEWNRLALSVILEQNNYENIIEEYSSYFLNIGLEKKILIERIKSIKM